MESRAQAVKLLKSWGIKFSGEEKDDPEEFLEKTVTRAPGSKMTTC